MSTLSNYLKMTAEELDSEITKQQRKINSAKETIALLKKLQIAANVNIGNQQKQKTQNAPQPQQQMAQQQNPLKYDGM